VGLKGEAQHFFSQRTLFVDKNVKIPFYLVDSSFDWGHASAPLHLNSRYATESRILLILEVK